MLTSLFRQKLEKKKLAFDVKSRRTRQKNQVHTVIINGLIPYVSIKFHHCTLITAMKNVRFLTFATLIITFGKFFHLRARSLSLADDNYRR